MMYLSGSYVVEANYSIGISIEQLIRNVAEKISNKANLSHGHQEWKSLFCMS